MTSIGVAMPAKRLRAPSLRSVCIGGCPRVCHRTRRVSSGWATSSPVEKLTHGMSSFRADSRCGSIAESGALLKRGAWLLLDVVAQCH